MNTARLARMYLVITLVFGALLPSPENQEIVCSICQEEVSTKKINKKNIISAHEFDLEGKQALPGQVHIFHQDCLAQWDYQCTEEGRLLSCPVCREPIHLFNTPSYFRNSVIIKEQFCDAIEKGNKKNIISMLNRHPFLLLGCDVFGMTSLMQAVLSGKLSIVQLLFDRYVMLAKDYKIPSVVSYLNAIDMNGQTALMHAAQRGYTVIVRFLVNAGADCMIKDQCGRTAGDFAAGNKFIQNALSGRLPKRNPAFYYR